MFDRLNSSCFGCFCCFHGNSGALRKKKKKNSLLWVCHEWAGERAYVSLLELSAQSFVCRIGQAPRIKGNSVVPELRVSFSPSPPQPPFLSLIGLGWKSLSRILWLLSFFLSRFPNRTVHSGAVMIVDDVYQAPHTWGSFSWKEGWVEASALETLRLWPPWWLKGLMLWADALLSSCCDGLPRLSSS